MSDTPETDRLMADYGGHHPHPMEAVDLARKLERERDEARWTAEVFRAAVEQWHGSQVPFPRVFSWEKRRLDEPTTV